MSHCDRRHFNELLFLVRSLPLPPPAVAAWLRCVARDAGSALDVLAAQVTLADAARALSGLRGEDNDSSTLVALLARGVLAPPFTHRPANPAMHTTAQWLQAVQDAAAALPLPSVPSWVPVPRVRRSGQRHAPRTHRPSADTQPDGSATDTTHFDATGRTASRVSAGHAGLAFQTQLQFGGAVAGDALVRFPAPPDGAWDAGGEGEAPAASAQHLALCDLPHARPLVVFPGLQALCRTGVGHASALAYVRHVSGAGRTAHATLAGLLTGAESRNAQQVAGSTEGQEGEGAELVVAPSPTPRLLLAAVLVLDTIHAALECEAGVGACDQLTWRDLFTAALPPPEALLASSAATPPAPALAPLVSPLQSVLLATWRWDSLLALSSWGRQVARRASQAAAAPPSPSIPPPRTPARAFGSPGWHGSFVQLAGESALQLVADADVRPRLASLVLTTPPSAGSALVAGEADAVAASLTPLRITAEAALAGAVTALALTAPPADTPGGPSRSSAAETQHMVAGLLALASGSAPALAMQALAVAPQHTLLQGAGVLQRQLVGRGVALRRAVWALWPMLRSVRPAHDEGDAAAAQWQAALHGGLGTAGRWLRRHHAALVAADDRVERDLPRPVQTLRAALRAKCAVQAWAHQQAFLDQHVRPGTVHHALAGRALSTDAFRGFAGAFRQLFQGRGLFTPWHSSEANDLRSAVLTSVQGPAPDSSRGLDVSLSLQQDRRRSDAFHAGAGGTPANPPTLALPPSPPCPVGGGGVVSGSPPSTVGLLRTALPQVAPSPGRLSLLDISAVSVESGGGRGVPDGVEAEHEG
ncbi:unnamed protein product, partial [Symbiodinium sp. KB8]